MNSIVNSILGGDPFGEHDKAPELLAKLNSAHLDGNYFELASEPKSVETLEELKSMDLYGDKDWCLGILQSMNSAFPMWYFYFEREALNEDQVVGIEGFILSDNRILVPLVTHLSFTHIESCEELFNNADDFISHVAAYNG